MRSRALRVSGRDDAARDRSGAAVGQALGAARGGDADAAEDLLRGALSEDPHSFDALCLLGELSASGGRHAQAAQHYRAALALQPESALAMAGLGRALRGSGDLDGAVTCLKRAFELAPTAGNLNELGIACLDQGDATRALRVLKRAIALDPALAEAHCNLGLAYRALGHKAKALDCLERAAQLAPDLLPALSNYGAALREHDRHDEAFRVLSRAVELEPRSVDALCNLGVVLRELGRVEEACAAFRRALSVEPDHAASLCGLGLATQDLGQADEALRFYSQVLERDPQNAMALVNRGFSYLLEGDFRRGWIDYEQRRHTEERPQRGFPMPEWDGSSLRGRTVLAYAEQGLGDEIMFASCLPDLIAAAGHCIIDCDPRLAPLFARSFPGATVHGGPRNASTDWLEAMGAVHCQVPFGTLPRFFRNDWSDFPSHAGYLKADAGLLASWRERLGALGGALRIGIAWRGGLARTRSASRSLCLERLAPLLGDPRLRFVSLQHGDHAAEILALRERHGIVLHQFDEAAGDYDRFAALVGALDLVISVCSSVIHLAGALGKPVWVLTPFAPEWRYLRRGERMPWYPSARLFRQPAAGDWDSVLAAVTVALAQTLAGDAGAGAKERR